jgi:hypothetical protein
MMKEHLIDVDFKVGQINLCSSSGSSFACFAEVPE